VQAAPRVAIAVEMGDSPEEEELLFVLMR